MLDRDFILNLEGLAGHPCASPLRDISPARWSARLPPVGASSVWRGTGGGDYQLVTVQNGDSDSLTGSYVLNSTQN